VAREFDFGIDFRQRQVTVEGHQLEAVARAIEDLPIPFSARLPRPAFDAYLILFDQQKIGERSNPEIRAGFVAEVEVAGGRGQDFDDELGIDEGVVRVFEELGFPEDDGRIGMDVQRAFVEQDPCARVQHVAGLGRQPTL
jgi:hypothetical protein